jgi:hypothetical protein
LPVLMKNIQLQMLQERGEDSKMGMLQTDNLCLLRLYKSVLAEIVQINARIEYNNFD